MPWLSEQARVEFMTRVFFECTNTALDKQARREKDAERLKSLPLLDKRVSTTYEASKAQPTRIC